MKNKAIIRALGMLLAAAAFLAAARFTEKSDAAAAELTQEHLLSDAVSDGDMVPPDNTEEQGGGTESGASGVPAERIETIPPQPGSSGEQPAEPRLPSQDAETVVYSFQQLKSALEDDNGITSVFFGGDIAMQSGGIRINPKKQYVTVSGLNPQEPGAGPYTLTDYSSASFYNTIYIDAAGISALKIQDMRITGKNYYGPFSVYDSSSLSGVTLIYERIDYNGPQLCYHRSGTVYIKDCSVRIHGGNGGSLNQEFSEVKHLVFDGSSSIETASSANSVFWHPLGGSFTLADDSALDLKSPDTSVLYGVFFADLSTYKIDVTIGERAKLNMTVSAVVTPDAYVTLSGFTVREGGSFCLNTTKTTTAAVLKIAGALKVEKEASFSMLGYGGSGASGTLLRQEVGDITVESGAVFELRGDNAFTSLLNLAGSSFICDDPAGVLLYNAGRLITATTAPAGLYISAQQVNVWSALHPGGLDAPAPSKWDKPDGSVFIIDGVISAGANGDFTEISSNYSPGDPPGTAPGTSGFSMKSARVLAFGRLELAIGSISAGTSVISGVTRAQADVRASYAQGGENYILPDVTSDSMGIFRAYSGRALDEGAVVTVKSAWRFLSASSSASAVAEGGLSFIVPETMEFFQTAISPSRQIIRRLHPNWEIVVSDGRDGGCFCLYARLGSELAPDNAALPPLSGALIYVDEEGAETVIGTDSDVLIASRESSADEGVYPVSWDEDRGVLLSVSPGTVFSDTTYSAPIIWTLADCP